MPAKIEESVQRKRVKRKRPQSSHPNLVKKMEAPVLPDEPAAVYRNTSDNNKPLAKSQSRRSIADSRPQLGVISRQDV